MKQTRLVALERKDTVGVEFSNRKLKGRMERCQKGHSNKMLPQGATHDWRNDGKKEKGTTAP